MIRPASTTAVSATAVSVPRPHRLVWLALALAVVCGGASACFRGSSQLASSEPLIRGIEGMHNSVKRFMLAAANEMPEEDFTFKPVAEVRTGGQLFLHVAYWQFFFCGEAKGEKPERPALLTAFHDQRENLQAIGATKASIIAAVQASYDYCDAVFTSLTPEQAGQIIAAPRFMNIDQAPRVHFLAYNVSHANEHYGNIVTYLRLKGRTPPSSQPR
jgi:uncharacterized damage-inducible protein DinB